MLFVSKIIACNGATSIRSTSRCIALKVATGTCAPVTVPVRTRSPPLLLRARCLSSSSSVGTTTNILRRINTKNTNTYTYGMNNIQRPFTTSTTSSVTTITNQNQEKSESLLDYTNSKKIWNVYLSGEIHTNWRDEIAIGIQQYSLPIEVSFPILNHADSDDCGAYILGMCDERPVWDQLGAKMNAIRTQTLIKDADIVIVKFGEQYRQWNAAYDVGYAAAHNKSIIVIHPPSLSHMLKEVNASANVVCTTTQQAIDTLQYVVHGKLPTKPKDGDQYVPIANRLGKGNPNP